MNLQVNTLFIERTTPSGVSAPSLKGHLFLPNKSLTIDVEGVVHENSLGTRGELILVATNTTSDIRTALSSERSAPCRVVSPFNRDGFDIPVLVANDDDPQGFIVPFVICEVEHESVTL